MPEQRDSLANWVRLTIICGMAASAVYPLLNFVPMPKFLTVLFAASWGPLLSFASIGLYQIFKANKRTVTLTLAVASNLIAGAVVNMMMIVQLARRLSAQSLTSEAGPGMAQTLPWIFRGVYTVQAGLDVSWDIYIGIGTLLFGLNALYHPRYGKVVGSIGIALALLLLSFNLISFPVPPADAGLMDWGPFVGLWYLVLTIQTIVSRKSFQKLGSDRTT